MNCQDVSIRRCQSPIIDAILELSLRACEYVVQYMLRPGPLVLLKTKVTHGLDKFVYFVFLGKGVGIVGRVAYEVTKLSEAAVHKCER